MGRFITPNWIIYLLMKVLTMARSPFVCKYCKKPMNKIEYEMYKGYCLKCRDIKDWKQILKDTK